MIRHKRVSFLCSTGAFSGGSGVAATTWSTTALNSAHAVLSNGNLTVTTDSTQGIEVCGRASAAITSGQRIYFEINDNNFNGTSNKRAVGLAVSSLTYPAGGNNLGFDSNLSIGGYGSTGIFVNSLQVGAFTNFGTGDIVGIAVDRNSNKAWFRTNAGNWNNDVIANQNPAVGSQVGGMDISAITANGDVYPAYEVFNNLGVLDQYTANFIGPMSGTIPTGFSAYAH